jgi:hypothetical protein
MSRDSMMLIRGGANYAYDQINHEIQAWLEAQYGLTQEDVNLAVVGLRHNDCYWRQAQPVTRRKWSWAPTSI